MSSLQGKNVLLGISGGIAAYKIPVLVRLLKKKGAAVRVVMTPDAHQFVTPLTLSTLSQEEVLTRFTAPTPEGHPEWNDHVALGKWADYFLIAPATSNTLSAMVHAKCNNLLIATYLSATCPIFIAPAMDLDMYAHPANQKNLEQLQNTGHQVLPVGEGFLASGLEGKGRMLEPEVILGYLEAYNGDHPPLLNKKVLITAGPTYEAIDPVRFIGNFSSGKMGFALAEAAAARGAEVILVSGPTHLQTEFPNIEVERVQTADEMYAAVHKHYATVDYAIAAAAVADFKPQHAYNQKIKKIHDKLDTISLKPTPDILASMGVAKNHQVLMGFALETTDELKQAKKKLHTKNLNAIVLNSLNDPGAGFSGDTNKVTLIFKDERTISFPLQSKKELANRLWEELLEYEH